MVYADREHSASIAYLSGFDPRFEEAILVVGPDGPPAILVGNECRGMATAALFTIMMDKSDSDSAATDYTVQASAVVLATGGAAAVSGYMAEALGYPAHFLASSLLCALGVVLAGEVLAREGADSK